MYKACSRCGRIHPQNYKCNVGRIYQGGEERKLRSGYDWTQKSLAIREKANNLCEVCRDKGIYTYNDIEVHHIVKVREDASKLLDDYNLIALCVEHHKQADEGKLDVNYLKGLVEKRENSL